MTCSSWSQFLHALPYPLHAARRGPPLEEVDALALLHPDRPRHALPQVAAEEVESLLAPAQIDPPRLLGMQLQLQTREDDPHASFGFLAVVRGSTHNRKVVRVADQRAEIRTPLLPHVVEEAQVDVRE